MVRGRVSSFEATSCPIWRAGDSGRLMKVVLLVLLVLSEGHLVPDLFVAVLRVSL